MNETLDFYNNNAEAFVNGTVSVDFKNVQDQFLQKLPNRAHILDFGCGSGRDTKYFLEKGFAVDATDGSLELCKIASAYAGVEVKHMLFQELDEKETYDGIWACASILHLKKEELLDVLGKMRDALKKDGVIYTSFKYGDFEGVKGGRYFTYFTEGAFKAFLETVGGLKISEYWVSEDVRPDRSGEKWLNLFLEGDRQ